MVDKVIVVTGASAGIGAALAEKLAARGARLVLVARRRALLETLAAPWGERAVVVEGDIGEEATSLRAAEAGLAQFGRLDAWVNNAGRGITRAVTALTDDDLDEMMRVNVKPFLYSVRAALPTFRAQGSGHFVQVSSMLGRVPFASFRSAYSASKHALNALSANLRMELRETAPGVAVSTVHPGPVATEFGVASLHGGVDSRKIPGAQSADEVADVIVDVLETRRADVYTQAGGRAMVLGYLGADDLAEAESRPPFVRPR